ncbi:MAG TPA: SdrD B-like domain-containing protein [Pseudonocardiaceae bacterium]
MRRIYSAVLLLCLGTAPVLMSTPAFAADSGGSICGTVWQDVNGDGIRQAAEPPMAGVEVDIGHATGVKTDSAGHYCFTGLSKGTYTLQAGDLALLGGYGWTLPGHDSKVDWTNGTSGPITVTGHIENVDVGYRKSTDDLRPVQLLIDINGETKYASDQTWATTPFHVGDTFTVYGTVGVDGNLPDELGGTLTVPDGLTVLDTAGGMPSSVTGPHQVTGRFPARRFPGDIEFLGAVVRVDKPFEAGQLKIQVAPGTFDANPNNDTLTEPLSAIAVPPRHTSTTRPAPPTTTTTTTHAVAVVPTTTSVGGPTVAQVALTRPLPNTGGGPIVPVVGGLALVMAGLGAFVLIRHRNRRSPIK